MNPRSAVGHLTPDAWARANRALVRKALAEFAHERLITPEPLGGGRYAVRGDGGAVEYRFTATVLSLDHWHIDAAGITRHRDGVDLPLDAADLIVELRGALGLSDEVLPVYLEEIWSTLAGAAFKLAGPPVPAAELAGAGFQDVEAGMTEGHPCFVANNGRLGYGVHDHLRYAPEAARPVRLIWLAAHRDHCTFTCSPDTDYDRLMLGELGAATLDRFAGVLAGHGLDPADYRLLPVHPWQWWHKISVTFAAELAERRLVCLGPGDDRYLAQQSVRTFFNRDTPERHYVKTALSVLNMGFTRGLSAEYMAGTPAINEWVAGLIAGDEVLRRTGLTILRERAAIGYHHRRFEAVTGRSSPYRKMLAALWRESPVPGLAPGRRPVTMASLLHVDREGRSFAAALIERSGLPPRAWLRRYLDAYLIPVLHCLQAYDLAFMPHGENVILVLHGDVVERVIFKDIAEEVVVMDPDADLPPEVHRVRAHVPEHERPLAVFTDVFDCFLRFLNAILATGGVLAEDDFWRTVAECVAGYQDAVPEPGGRPHRYDLFAATFPRSCLNRLQLRDNRRMVDLADPSAALQFAGELANPIAVFLGARFARAGS
ncbi:IucA/IucC family protein, partial [Sphaerisporangium rufum]|uniref:IucA/IucC family protein n=1 Tax=Sphaerisporangium rufum TaxID=1381558 RepID=UPI00194EFE4A